MFWLGWLVRQETMHVQNVMEMLEDDELLALVKKMEQGRECRQDEGSDFVEAGLMKEVTWELGA